MSNAGDGVRSIGVVGRFFRQPVSVIALILVLLITIAVTFASAIAPYPPLLQDLYRSLQGPSPAHPLGTDSLGRDVFSRLLYGGQTTLLGVLVGCACFVVVGVILGLVAGYFGGLTDRTISGVADTLLALPGIVIVLAVLAIFSQSVYASMITFGVLSSGGLIRVVRATVLSVREELYVAAARVSGTTPARILFRHILPGLYAPIMVQLSLFAGICLAVQTGLGFLGVSTPPPAPSWGGMVGDAAVSLAQAPYYLYFSGGIIFVMTLGFAVVGDGLRDAAAVGSSGDNPLRQRLGLKGKSDQSVEPFAGKREDSPLLSVENLTVGFRSNGNFAEVLHSISFDLERGEIVGLVGESGSGKTLTGLTIIGLLDPDAEVMTGSCKLEGEDLLRLDERGMTAIRGRRIGLVSQEPMVALDPLFSVGDQLMEVLRHFTGGTRKSLRDRAVRLLGDVRLSDPESVLAKRPYELSGGMIQRVVIAMALAGDPEILIADEPTTALDVTVQAGVLDLLRELKSTREMSILFVTHDLGVVADICDRAIVLEAGRIVEAASVDELFAAPKHEYTRRLIASTPSLLGES